MPMPTPERLNEALMRWHHARAYFHKTQEESQRAFRELVAAEEKLTLYTRDILAEMPYDPQRS